MPFEISLGRPVLVFTGGEDVSVSESQNVARQVLFDLHPFRYEDFIIVADTHQAFIKGPVAEAAKGKAVCGLVIMPLAPRFDVGRLNDRVAVRREHPNAASASTTAWYLAKRSVSDLDPFMWPFVLIYPSSRACHRL